MAAQRPAVRRVVVGLPAERPAAALMRGIRLPGAAVVGLVLLVVGVLVLAPSVGRYLDERQHVADLAAGVARQRSDLTRLTAQHARWSDPAYIREQAGTRLFYVLPGETVYRVTGEPATAAATAPAPTRAVRQTPTDWAAALYGSLLIAGTTRAAPGSLPAALPTR